MPRVIVFDDGKGELAPLTGTYAAFDVRIGAFTTLGRIARAGGAGGGGGASSLIVPEPLADLTRERHAMPVNEPAHGNDPVLLLNGRAPLASELASGLGHNAAIIDRDTGDLIAAHVPGGRVRALLGGDHAGLQTRPVDGLNLMTRPWHVRLLRERCLAADLDLLACDEGSTPPLDATAFGNYPLSIDPTANIYPGAVFDLENGPIVLAAASVVRPGAVVIGPAYIGPHSTVMDRAIIRAGTAIGPHCKVGGEVAGTVFQGYSNKAHDGYLGDSWVGEWVNLGAATNNSNLLNTYGEVKCRATPKGPEEPTGERFVGAFIGDHVKTAIGTRIMTGAVIHTGAMLAAAAPVTGCVPPFAWRTDAGESTWDFEKFERTARAMMARRKVTPSAVYMSRLRALHAAAASRP